MKKLGFGFLRPPRLGTSEDSPIDYELLSEMVDAFLAGGGVYFDTAYTYLNGLSEDAIRRCLVERHPRSAYRLADKLPGYKVRKKEDCRRYFEEQCRRCGVEWFDVYLLHWLNPENYRIAEEFEEFSFLQTLKNEGKAEKIGFSYHGNAALLEQILTAHPEVDIVQLQINYLDWEDPGIQSRKCYEAACRHGKEVVVMEPVKGGTLATLPEEAEALLRAHAPEESPAAWAIRFAQSLPQVGIVLSGMNTMAQLRDNQRDLPTLAPEETALLARVCQILNGAIAVPCTACRYCVDHCPKNIPIPDYFRLYNTYCRHPEEDWKIQPVYAALAQGHGLASQCIGCSRCQKNCPQGIPIPDHLAKVTAALEG